MKNMFNFEKVLENAKKGIAVGLIGAMLATGTACALPKEGGVDQVQQEGKDLGKSSPNYSVSGEKELESLSPRFEKASQTMLNTFASDYYKNLVDMAEKGELDTKTSKYFSVIPYGFMESQGLDIDAIKNDEMYCRADAFLDYDRNEMYYAITYENEKGNYNQYVIKYQLEDGKNGEIEELYSLFRVKASQAPLYLQEISYTHKPFVLSKTEVTRTTYENSLECAYVNAMFIDAVHMPRGKREMIPVFIGAEDYDENNYSYENWYFLANIVDFDEFNIREDVIYDRTQVYVGKYILSKSYMQDGVLTDAVLVRDYFDKGSLDECKERTVLFMFFKPQEEDLADVTKNEEFMKGPQYHHETIIIK